MSISSVKRVGVLTSGGDAPGLNAAIRGLCLTGIKKYGMKFVGILDGYKGFEQGRCIDLNIENIDSILSVGGTLLGSAREKPFKNKEKIKETGLSAIESIKKHYKDWKLDAVVVLGGNGSNTTAGFLSNAGLNVIGLPKTIDNDIVHTDYTFGFSTAVECATECIERIKTTAFSHSRVMVVEVMGHKVGWIALHSGIASGADVILLPEIPYQKEIVAKKILENAKVGKKYSIVVVSEGAQDTNESKLDKKAFKKVRSSMGCSIGERVAKEIENETGLETRVTVLGHLQRGGSPNPYDRFMATHFGATACDYICKKEFGKILVWQNNSIKAIPLELVSGQTKKIPFDCDMIQTAKNIGISFGG